VVLFLPMLLGGGDGPGLFGRHGGVKAARAAATLVVLARCPSGTAATSTSTSGARSSSTRLRRSASIHGGLRRVVNMGHAALLGIAALHPRTRLLNGGYGPPPRSRRRSLLTLWPPPSSHPRDCAASRQRHSGSHDHPGDRSDVGGVEYRGSASRTGQRHLVRSRTSRRSSVDGRRRTFYWGEPSGLPRTPPTPSSSFSRLF